MRRRSRKHISCPAGGLPQPRRLGGRWRHPAGGLPSLPPADLAFSLLFCPHPPNPLPLRGRGRFFSFLMQGAPPLASPGLDGTRHWLDLRWRCLAGDLPSLPPAAPAFSLLSCPHPPNPLPLRGRGRLLVFLCKGLRPLHPRGWMGRGTGSTCVSGARRGACLEGSVSAVGDSVSGCRGRSPRRNKLWVSPFPPGRGAGGWGQKARLKAGLASDKEGKPPGGYSGGKVSRRPTGQAPAGRVVRSCSQRRGGGTKPSRGGATTNKPPRDNPGWLVKPVPVATEQPAQTAAYRITLSDRSPSAVSQYRFREPFSAPR